MVKGRSARGVEVNFDAMKIKEQLVDRPAPVEVQAREDFVDQRLKRRARRKAQEAAKAEQAALEQQGVLEEEVDPDELLDEKDLDNEVDDVIKPPKTERKQRTPKKKV